MQRTYISRGIFICKILSFELKCRECIQISLQPYAGAELQCYDWGQLTPTTSAQTLVYVAQSDKRMLVKIHFDPSDYFIQVCVSACAHPPVQAQNW
jgi:hypothetical protein